MSKTLLTPEQYLAIEREAEYKSEYFQGEMLAMAVSDWVHNQLVVNLVAGFHNQFRSRPCDVYPSQMRVLVRAMVGCRLALADLYEKVDLPGEPWRHSTTAAIPSAR